MQKLDANIQVPPYICKFFFIFNVFETILKARIHQNFRKIPRILRNQRKRRGF